MWISVLAFQAVTAAWSAKRGINAETAAKDAAGKSASNAIRLFEQGEKLETIHILVNSAKGELLRSQYVLAERIAALTKSARDREVARHYKQLSKEHDARQKLVDEASIRARDES